MTGKLSEPINIGTLKLPNRLVMPPMFTSYGDSSGAVTQRLVDYYAERAKNNVGLIIIEAICVMRGGRLGANQLCIYDDIYLPGLSRLAEAIHQAGAKCFVQIHHAGRRAHAVDNGGIQPVAPSPIAMLNGEMPRELAIEEIEEIIEAFAQGAVRARKAGFDGVELHFAHAYLVAQFLSPLTNKRMDKYGGDLASRARLAVEIAQRVRQRVGKAYPVSARISGNEYIKGGLTPADAPKIVVMLEEAGVDALNVSISYAASSEEGFLSCSMTSSVAPMTMPRGFALPVAEAVKKVAKVPVFAVGRLDDPQLAEEAVARGKADVIAIGRGFLTDPAFAAKVLSGQHEDIRRCIACNCCISNLFVNNNLTCTVNAELGKEAEYRIKPAAKAKRVVIVGGGPAGMEAARVAALRGHSVTLLEKKSGLGGNLLAASAVSFKNNISLFTDFLSQALQKLHVEVRLTTEASASRIMSLKPDAVIVATGASPVIPTIPGVKGSNVTDAVQVLEGKAETGARVVVAGGGSVGCEVAVFLVEKGKQVSIVEMRDTDYSATGGLALDMDPYIRKWLFMELWPRLGIDVIGKSTFQEVTAKGLVVGDREGGRRLVVGDTIVLAAGMVPNNGLVEKLKGKVPEVYAAGDCVQPAHIIDAVGSAARIARLV